MKIDKIRFARLLVYIAGIVQRNNLDSTDINVLDDMIDIEVPEQQAIYPKNESVERLMMLMVEGTRKIEAIKEHRSITGMGLKESKDAVERYWPNSKEKTAKELLQDMYDKLGNDNELDFGVIKPFLDSFYL